MPAPAWSSSFHKFSFQRLSALSFTQFDKVIVMDNDMAVLRNFDQLAAAETPALVWHSAAPFMLKLGERCSVSGGLFVLRPSRAEYERALAHLKGMYVGERCTRKGVCFRYDGSDQEFWRSFYSRPYELPIRFHATNYLKRSSPNRRAGPIPADAASALARRRADAARRVEARACDPLYLGLQEF
eukprot:5531141-Prymnesium_polylepis.1